MIAGPLHDPAEREASRHRNASAQLGIDITCRAQPFAVAHVRLI